MSDRRRLIGRGDGATFQFPSALSSPDSSDNENLVYQREAPTTRERGRKVTVERNGAYSGSKPLVASNQTFYSSISEPMPERMDMDYNGKGGPTFSRKKGFFLERRWAYLLIVLFIGSLLLVGLLVGLLGPNAKSCSPEEQSGETSKWGESTLTPEEARALRLPRAIIPVAYNIQLQPFINGNLSVPGSMSLVVQCLENTRSITLNVHNVNITQESVRLNASEANVTAPEVTEVKNDPDHQFVIIYLDSDLTVNASYTLQLSFVGEINNELAGLYKSTYQNPNGTHTYLAVTQFEATDARRVFPCFDEPAFKATFDISIIRENNMTAISNAPVIKTESRGDGWSEDFFDTTPKMSTYLVAFVISDFAHIAPNNSSFRVWARKEVISSANYTASIGPGIIDYYNNFFDIHYPMNKTDNVAIPDFNAGAMENWGIITYRETSMLFDPQLSTAYDKQYICQTVAHELAHQWFGNLVTPAWWNDLWLNEGFASYMEYVASDIVEPDWKMLELFITDKQQSAQNLDSLKSSHPISAVVGSPDEINDLFDGISYDKGASIIRMMNLFLGEEVFKTGLQNYLKNLAYSNAVSDDLWEYLYQAQNQTNAPHPVNVSDIMNKWSQQTGYPLVTVTRNYTDTNINLTQNIFLIDSSNATEDETALWDIPITWADSSMEASRWSTYPKLWLNNRTVITNEIKTSKNDWIIFNVQAAGFYRVNYDNENWQMIINQLITDHTKIDVITRTQIIDDAFNLARAGVVTYRYSLDLTKYLSSEKEYLPFISALAGMGTISGMLCRSDVYGILKTYILSLILPSYMRFGWNDMSRRSVQEQYLQSEAISIACNRDYPDCINKAKTLFNVWKRNPGDKTIINPNLRSTVYCTGIANGNSSDWDFVFSRFKNETIPAEKSRLRSALGCTREMWLLSKLLRLAMDPINGIATQDATMVITQVAGTDYGRELAFDYIREKWDMLFEMFGKLSFSLSEVISAIARRLNTPSEMNDFLAFKEKVFKESKEGTAKSSFKRAIELINSNVQFMNRSYDEISSWFLGRNNNTTSFNSRLTTSRSSVSNDGQNTTMRSTETRTRTTGDFNRGTTNDRVGSNDRSGDQNTNTRNQDNTSRVNSNQSNGNSNSAISNIERNSKFGSETSMMASRESQRTDHQRE